MAIAFSDCFRTLLDFQNGLKVTQAIVASWLPLREYVPDRSLAVPRPEHGKAEHLV